MVIHDFTACNSTELSIRRGQTVEVLERPHDKPDWCLVRTTDRSPAAEGLVPCGSLCIAHSRSSMEMEGIFNHKGRTVGGVVAGHCPLGRRWHCAGAVPLGGADPSEAGVETRTTPVTQQ